MNYLLSLTSALTTDERDKTAQGLKGHERTVYEKALAVCRTPNAEEQFTPQAFGLSRSHFDKICSVLVNKVYRHLTDGSFTEISRLLLVKGLTPLLLHQIAIETRRIKKVKSRYDRKVFYNAVFETLRRFSFDLLDLKLMRKYAELLKPLLGPGDVDTPAIVELKCLYIEGGYYFSHGKVKQQKARLLKAIQAALPKPEKHKGSPVYSHYQLCMATYLRDYEDKLPEAMQHARMALENCTRKGAADEETFVANMHGMYGTLLCQCSHFEEAYTIYSQAFEKYGHLMSRSFYHNLMYATVTIISARYAIAERHMEKYMKGYLDGGAALYYRYDVLRVYTLFNLYQRRYDTAFTYLKQAQNIRRSETTEVGDIMLRMIENLYFLLTADYLLAISLSQKNIRFLKRRGYTYDNCEYMHLFYAAGALAKMKIDGKVDRASIAHHLEKSKTGILKIYGGLLDEVK